MFGANNYSDEDRYRAKAEKALRQMCVDYKEKYTGIDNCYRVGVPCEEIAAAARGLKSDLVIISTHNYHWLDHLINGSDAERIVRRVSCPILVVPQDRDSSLIEVIENSSILRKRQKVGEASRFVRFSRSKARRFAYFALPHGRKQQNKGRDIREETVRKDVVH